MKIVFIHTDFLVYWPKRIFSLNAFLEEKGHTLTVIEFSRMGTNYSFFKDNSYFSALDWHTLYPEQKMTSIKLRELKIKLFGLLNEFKPDVIFSGGIAFPSGALSIQYTLKHNIPLIIFNNARLEDVPRGYHVNLIKRQLYKHVDAMFVPSPSLNSTYQFFGFSPDQFFYGLNVVDNPFFMQRKTEVDQNMETLEGLPELFFLGGGRQEPRKNWVSLIKAFAIFNRRNPGNPFHLVLVGGGSQHTYLEGIAGEKVHFYPFQERDMLCRFYGNAAAFVLPSKFGETWGLVVNEAMASSLPVIVSKECGCASTLVHDGDNGWTFDPHDPEELASRLEQVANMSAGDREKMGNRSLTLVSDWGLDRFCKGAWEAIVYTSYHQKRMGTPLSRLLSRLWYGRYNVA